MCQEHYRLGYLARSFGVMFLLYPHGEFFGVLICILRALGKYQFLYYVTQPWNVKSKIQIMSNELYRMSQITILLYYVMLYQAIS